MYYDTAGPAISGCTVWSVAGWQDGSAHLTAYAGLAWSRRL